MRGLRRHPAWENIGRERLKDILMNALGGALALALALPLAGPWPGLGGAGPCPGRGRPAALAAGSLPAPGRGARPPNTPTQCIPFYYYKGMHNESGPRRGEGETQVVLRVR